MKKADKIIKKNKLIIKEERLKADKIYGKWLNKIQKQWKKGEWEAMRANLELLSIEQLRELTNKVGIIFAEGNNKISNKEEFILVLDEADKKELYRAYKEIKKKGD